MSAISDFKVTNDANFARIDVELARIAALPKDISPEDKQILVDTSAQIAGVADKLQGIQ